VGRHLRDADRGAVSGPGCGAGLARCADRAGRGGANRLYVQVEQDNAVAQRLYRRAGFGFAYRYHYRTRSIV
jgi:ribosomal protein S18 acetylase RimI-like enzyme